MKLHKKRFMPSFCKKNEEKISLNKKKNVTLRPIRLKKPRKTFSSTISEKIKKLKKTGKDNITQLMRSDNKKQQQHRINEQIRVREVRIVGDDMEPTVMPTRQALQLAEQKGVDLVEISPNANPPVCRLIDYSKFLYQLKKKQKELKAKQVKVEVKEIRFGPQTAEADYQFKLKHAQEFLKEGNKVKAYVFFRGRTIIFKEQGEVLLLRFANELEEIAKLEGMPKLEGKRMTIMLAPKKAGQPKKSQQRLDHEKAILEAKKNQEAEKAAQADSKVESTTQQTDKGLETDTEA